MILTPRRSTQGFVFALLLSLVAPLLLVNLGNHHLWQDEAQTAVIARTILSRGFPVGYDGRNHFSQELGIEYGEGYVWKWHTWLSFYVCAASLGLLGSTTLAARLPFALFALATVGLTGVAGRSFWRDPRAAAASAGLLALSVPFLLLGRQCRWYSMAAFFALLGLLAYTRLCRGERRHAWLLFGAATLLFHTHFLYAGTLLATLVAHAWALERARLGTVLRVAVAVTLVNLPWIAWFATIPYGANYASRLADPGRSLALGWDFGAAIFEHLFPPLLLLAPALLALLRWRAREPPVAVSAETRSNAALLVIFCGLNVAALAFAAPDFFFRYLAPLVPPLFLLAGLLVGALLRRSPVLGAALVGLWLASSALPRFAYELGHDYDGPIEGIVKFLREHASGDDVVLINYGDMPLKFYTNLRVVGGVTGEDLTPAREADWVILRHDDVGGAEDRRVRDFVSTQIDRDAYLLYELDYPDLRFENREDPALHRFWTAGKRGPRVRILGRKP